METNENVEVAVVRKVGKPVYEMGRWLQFLGIVMIVMSIIPLVVLGISLFVPLFGSARAGLFEGAIFIGITVVLSILPMALYVWLGILLNRAGKIAEPAYMQGNAELLSQSLSNLKTYFMVTGILSFIGLVVMLLGLCGGVLALLFGVWSSGISF